LNLSLTKTFANFEARMITSKTGAAPTSASNSRQAQQHNLKTTGITATSTLNTSISNPKYVAAAKPAS
jgi:hypothetical protein